MHSRGLSFRFSPELGGNEQLDACFLGGRTDLPLNINSRSRNGTDDDLHPGQSVLDGLVAGIVNLDHLDVPFNRGLGALSLHSRSVLSDIAYRVDTYLAGKDDDLLDDTGSFVLQQLLNDVGTDGTCPNDGEVCISRHELTLGCVGDFWGYRCFALLYLSSS